MSRRYRVVVDRSGCGHASRLAASDVRLQTTGEPICVDLNPGEYLTPDRDDPIVPTIVPGSRIAKFYEKWGTSYRSGQRAREKRDKGYSER